MSEHSYLREQSIGTQFSGVYYVSSVSIKKAKTNTEYSEYTLKDKSGTVFAKLWGIDPTVKKGVYVSAVINVDDYQGAASYIVRSVKVYDKEVDPSKYMAIVENSEELVEKFNAYVEIVKETSEKHKIPLYKILNAVFTKEFKEKFFKTPASLGNYYGKVGGALENTINICRNVMSSASVYDFCEVEQGVLLTSALLSRIGSVETFAMENCAVEKTTKGSLIGVQTASSIILHDAWKTLKTDPADEAWFTKVFHAVTSAEGTENLPCTKEAILLKNIMAIDATMSDMFDYISRDEHIEDGFTTFDVIGKRRYFVGK